MNLSNNNSRNQKTSNMINNLGNILTNNNINNMNQQSNNYQQNDLNKKMIQTNSSINFQSQKENLNPQIQNNDPLQKVKNRTSLDLNNPMQINPLNQYNENTMNTNNYPLLRANSTMESNKMIDLSERSLSNLSNDFINNNNNCNDPNALFNELNMMYNNNPSTQNSILLNTERDEKELNRLKENYYNISNKLKSDQRVFNKEGNNSLVGMLQLLKMEGELRKNIESPNMNINELQEIYRTIVEYGQTMFNKVDCLKNTMNEKNDLRNKIRNFSGSENNSLNNVSNIEEISHISNICNDFSQIDQEMDLSSH